MSGARDPGSLARLVDIVEAPALSLWWPLPPLLWLVLALLAIGALVWLLRFQRRWRADRYRREALASLAAAPADPLLRLRRARALLKRAAMTAYGREDVAPLAGAAWWAYLDTRAAGVAFAAGPGPASDRALARDCPPAPDELSAFETATAQWLRRHRPR